MNETVDLVANVSLALSFVTALIFGIAQVKASARDRKDRLTLETLRAFNTREFSDLMIFIGSDRFPKNHAEMNALSTEDRVRFIQYSQEMESLGILVEENFIDIELVDKTLGAYVITSWEKYKPIIEYSREHMDRYNSEYFELLAKRLQERFETSPRKPAYENPPRKS